MLSHLSKSLRGTFTTFDQGLFKEITKMKEVFNQMQTKVDKCSVERKCFEIKEKALLLQNDHLLEQILSQDVLCIAMHADVVNNCVVLVNDNHLAYAEMEQSYIDEYIKVLELKAELSKMKDMVEKVVYDELSNQCSRIENQFNNSHVIALRMYKQDLPPLYTKLKWNREVHVDYLKQAKAYADTLHSIVEQARALKPLDNLLDYACKYEVEESLTAAPRPAGGHGIDYRFIGSLDAKTRRQRAEEVGYGIRDTWVDPREATEEITPVTLEGVNTRVTELTAVQEQDTQDIYAVIEDA
ncbi:hypothetical protein Tco_0441680 [Tanacetum coccineum]